MPAFTGEEAGLITEVDEQENAFIVYFRVEEDFELGVTLFKDDLFANRDENGVKRFWRPEVGEGILVNMGVNGLLNVEIDGDTIFTRTEDEAALWKEIRRLQVELARLQDKIPSV